MIGNNILNKRLLGGSHKRLLDQQQITWQHGNKIIVSDLELFRPLKTATLSTHVRMMKTTATQGIHGMTNKLTTTRHGILQITPLAQAQNSHGLLNTMLTKRNSSLTDYSFQTQKYFSISKQPPFIACWQQENNTYTWISIATKNTRAQHTCPRAYFMFATIPKYACINSHKINKRISWKK